MNKHARLVLVLGLAVLSLLLVFAGCAQTAAPAPPTSTVPAPPASPTPVPAAPSPAAKPTTPAAQPQTVIKWQMQAVNPLPSDGAQLFAVEWAAWVKDITNGRLQIEVQPPGTFAKGTDLLPTVGKGTIQASFDYDSNYSSTVPESNVESGLPLAWSNGLTDPWDAYYNRGMMDIMREVYAERNVFPVSFYTFSADYHFGTTFPFNSLDDIKGKKIRATGAFADYVEALGGKPTVVAPEEMYMALKTRTIDGMIYGAANLKTLKLAEVTPYYVLAPTLAPIVSTCPHINLDAWKALPADIRDMILKGTPSFYAQQAIRYKIRGDATNAWSKQQGVKFVTLSAADEKRALDINVKIWDKIAALSPRTAKLVNLVKQQLKDYGRLQ